MAITPAAPCCNMQSVKPTVEAPTSMQVRPVRSILHCASAASSFSPPRPTYFRSPPSTRISESCATPAPAFSTFCSFTRTRPASTSACARSREGAMPRSTRSLSIRTFIPSLLYVGWSRRLESNQRFRTFRGHGQVKRPRNEHAAFSEEGLQTWTNLHDLDAVRGARFFRHEERELDLRPFGFLRSAIIPPVTWQCNHFSTKQILRLPAARKIHLLLTWHM